MTISGAFAPVPTPLGHDDRIDVQALGKHLRWLAAEGLDGALILGTNGEFPSLDLAERRLVAEAAASTSTLLNLMLGVGSCALPDVLDLAEFAADLGYAAVLCPPPYYYRQAPIAGITEFFRRLLDASPLPVFLYHIPQVTGIPISDELLDALGQHENLAGVKDSSASSDEMRRLIARFPTGVYMVGNDHLLAECRAAGGSGSISAAASVAPALVAEVNRDPGRQGRLSAVRRLLEHHGLGPAVKAVLRSRGFGEYATRPPLVGLDERIGRQVATELKTLLESF